MVVIVAPVRWARRLLRALLLAFVCLLALAGLGWWVVRQPVLGALQMPAAAPADPRRLARHVAVLADELVPRDVDHPANLARAAAYVAGELAAQTPRVERQAYGVRAERYENVVARFGPAQGRPLVVGAHYDAFGDFGSNPGADDNASGVAGVLELARLLAARPPTVPVELVAWSTEEPPYFGSPAMGSAVHAAGLAAAGRAPLAVLCLEMIGYFSAEQPRPHPLFGLLYPRRGDFLVVGGRWRDRALVRHLQRAFRGAAGAPGRPREPSPGVPLHGFVAPAEMLEGSDHRSYWAHGFAAVLLTDTAFVRNPHYHSAGDTPATLDYRRMAAAVDGVANAVWHADRLPP